METLKVSFFSFMSLYLTTKDILDFLTATAVYALRKKQLKVFFIDHFKKIIKIRHNFHFYNPKLCSEENFVLSVKNLLLLS